MIVNEYQTAQISIGWRTDARAIFEALASDDVIFSYHFHTCCTFASQPMPLTTRAQHSSAERRFQSQMVHESPSHNDIMNPPGVSGRPIDAFIPELPQTASLFKEERMRHVACE